MTFKQIKRTTVLTAATAAAVYTYVAGKGPFNRHRFKEQHEVLARYVDGNYPDCSYNAITMHGNGWSAAIRRRGRIIRFVYFVKSPDGHYIFTESDEKFE